MFDYPNLNAALAAQVQSDKWITFIEGKQDQRRFSYAQLYDRARMLLFDFQEAGLKPGDQLIILHKDNQTFVEAFWACVFGGMVPVPIAVGISDEHRAKLFRVFTKLERPYLYTTQENLDRLNQFAEQYGLHESIQTIRHKTLLSNLMEDHAERGQEHTPQLDDICFIQFSSGSTSEPKGVVLTHRNVLVNLNAIAAGAGYTQDDISLSWMPLTHDMGLLGFHLNMVAVGMSQCLMPTDLFSRRPLLWMEKVSELKATVTCSPNFGYKHFLKALGNKTLDAVDLAHAGGQEILHAVAGNGMGVPAAELHQVVAAAILDRLGDGPRQSPCEPAVAKLVDVLHRRRLMPDPPGPARPSPRTA